MPYSYPDNVPNVAENWTDDEQRRCVAAANAVLAEDNSDEEAAIYACIHAAGKARESEIDMSKTRKDAPNKKEIKKFDLPVLALKIIDADQGIVEELVAVFGNIDHGKDRIKPGAFKKTVQEGVGSLLVLDQHNTDSIFRTLGTPQSLREVSRNELPPEVRAKFPDATGGLVATTKYLLETTEGKGAFVRIKEGAVKQRSIGFEVQDQNFETVKARQVETGYELSRDGKDITIRNLTTIKLMEYSPVLWGMNEATTTISAKDKESDPASTSEDDETLERPEDAATEKSAKDMTPFGPVRRMGETIVGNCESMCGMMVGGWLSQGMLSMEEHAQMEEAMSQAMLTFAQACPQELMNRELSSSGYYSFGRVGNQLMMIKSETGEMLAPSPDEEKAGRAISARNATRLKEALEALHGVLKDAGWITDGEDDQDEKSVSQPARVAPVSAPPATEDGAGQEDKSTPPTPQTVDLSYVQARLAQLRKVGGSNGTTSSNARKAVAGRAAIR